MAEWETLGERQLGRSRRQLTLVSDIHVRFESSPHALFMLEVKTSIILNDELHKIRIQFNIIPGSRGHCDKYGCPEEPDTPPELEVLSIEDLLAGKQVEYDALDPDDQATIDALCWNTAKRLMREADLPNHIIEQWP